MWGKVMESISVIGYTNHVNNPEVWAQNTKNHQIYSRPVSGCTLTKNSPQEIIKSENAWYPPHHAGKSLRLDSIYWNDFILLVIALFFNKVLIRVFVAASLRNKWYAHTNTHIKYIKTFCRKRF